MKKFLVSLIVLALCLFTIACGNTTDPGCNPDEECCDGVGVCPQDCDPAVECCDGVGQCDCDPAVECCDGIGVCPHDCDPAVECCDGVGVCPQDCDPAVECCDGVDQCDCDENSVICKIQTGQLSEGTEVTVNECVVTAIYYAQDDNFNNTAIKGIYVSDIIPEAKPYTGIYVFIKATAPVDDYAIGDKLEVKGTYKEYYENSQIEAAEIKKLGKADLPAPAKIADPATIATPFEVTGQDENGYDVYNPTANHGADAEKYEGVLVKVTDVEITNKYIGHGNFELDNSLVVTKTLYYYEGDRSKGVVFESVQGILVYEYNAFRLAPRAEEDFVEREQPPIKDDDDDVTDDSDTEEGDVVFAPATIKNIQSGQVAEKTDVRIEKAIVISPVITKDFTDGGKGYSFYVSDGNTGDYSGLYIYNATAATAPAKGDEVTIEGKLLLYGGSQWEIGSRDNVTCSMTKTGTAAVPAIVKKAYADLKEKDKGTYIEITDTNLKVASVDADHKDVTFTNGLVIKPNTFKINLSLQAGDTVSSVKGIYDNTFSTPGLVIVDANDVKK